MYAMQYEITLPADYDMTIIRQRVAMRGHALDRFAGLGLKAYCIRRRGVDGAPVNQYAPFYWWASVAGMNRFLWGGGGFRGILESFGRPVVRHWTGVACLAGPARAALPRTASRISTAIPEAADPEAVVEAELAALQRCAGAAGVHSVALAIDPDRWELVRFTLWQDEVPADTGVCYEVLHLSTPDLDALTGGRQW